jgi:hypothetical protein
MGNYHVRTQYEDLQTGQFFGSEEKASSSDLILLPYISTTILWFPVFFVCFYDGRRPPRMCGRNARGVGRVGGPTKSFERAVALISQ